MFIACSNRYREAELTTHTFANHCCTFLWCKGMPTLLFVVLKGVQICYGVALEDVLALAWKNASWKTGKNIDIPTFALKKKKQTL